MCDPLGLYEGVWIVFGVLEVVEFSLETLHPHAHSYLFGVGSPGLTVGDPPFHATFLPRLMP